ncbi:MAG: hypothetical protein M1832_001586 [Thelocarpon impressellum]|nr:MAG: hypothetical protein M1832_001586 [Thelocarpon impressellum]
MTPRLPKQSQQHQASDYESDLNVAALSDAGLTQPARPPSRTNAELNLSVLRRHDPSIAFILSIAPYAVVYLFSPTSQQWEKSGVEGTLFVCQLTPAETGAERYVAIVLNRRGLENFSAELLDGGDVEVTEEYVILRVTEDGEEQKIYGLWIFSEPPPSSTANTRAINAQIIQDCAVQAETSRRLVAAEEQQQEEDEGPQPAHAPYQQHQSALPFVPSSDTDFFRNPTRPSQRHKQQNHPPVRAQAPIAAKPPTNGNATQHGAQHGPNVLLELFRKAGEGYLAGGGTK